MRGDAIKKRGIPSSTASGPPSPEGEGKGGGRKATTLKGEKIDRKSENAIKKRGIPSSTASGPPSPEGEGEGYPPCRRGGGGFPP